MIIHTKLKAQNMMQMQSCSKITYFIRLISKSNYFNTSSVDLKITLLNFEAFEAKKIIKYLRKVFGCTAAVLCNLNFPALLFIISLYEGESGLGRLLSWQGCVWLTRAGLHLLLRLVNIYFLVIFIRHFSRFFR